MTAMTAVTPTTTASERPMRATSNSMNSTPSTPQTSPAGRRKAAGGAGITEKDAGGGGERAVGMGSVGECANDDELRERIEHHADAERAEEGERRVAARIAGLTQRHERALEAAVAKDEQQEGLQPT